MLHLLRMTGLRLSAALALVAFGTTVVTDAHAADDGDRRVLQARQVDETDLHSEYAKKAEEKRLQSINFLKELLTEDTAEGETKAEMMLRLADLYFEQARTIYLREMEAFDIEFDKCFNTEGCDTESMKADNVVSRDWHEKSIRLYQNILRSYPRYDRADEAVFYLGMALLDIGEKKEAIKYFDRLTKQYPQSSYAADSYVNLGEYYFEENDAFSALKNYKKVVDKYPESAKYSFSLYKLAWCYYNVEEYDKGISSMKLVVSNTQTQGGERSKLQLQDEALKDLVRFFADAGAMDEAYEYFTKLGKKELIRDMLKRLAGMYFEQGKFEQTIQTYRRLIGENPQSPDNPDYQSEIIKAYKKIGKREETIQEVDRLLKTYGKNSAWARANASDQEAVTKAGKTIEKELRNVAVEYHLHARALGATEAAKETYKLAYKSYKVYLEEFPESTHAYEMRYNFGELLFKIKRWDEAYEQFMAVVKIDPKGKHSQWCAENAIRAAENIVKSEGSAAYDAKGSGPIPPGPKVPQELTPWENNLVIACKQYADIFPGDEKVKAAIYKSAYLLYHKFRFDEAAQQFKAVIQMDPKSQQAMQAANLILDAFVITGDTSGLKTNAKFYYDQEGLGTAAFKKEVYGIYENASFKLIEENLEKDKNKSVAAEQFEAWYNEFPDSKQGALALNNASVYYFGETRLGDAMRVRHILIDDAKFGPKTKYYYDTIAALGSNYESIADFEKSASYYEKMFSMYKERRSTFEKEKRPAEEIERLDENARVGLYRSSYFRKAMGDWKAAINNYEKFISTFPDDDKVDDIKLTIAKTYEEQGDWTQAAAKFLNFYSKATKDTPLEFVYFARLHHAEALEKMGQQSKADVLYRQTADMYRKYVKAGGKPGAHSEFAAKMMYRLAQPQLDEYLAMRIKGLGRGAGQSAENRATIASLNKKKKALQAVQKTFEEIALTGSSEMGLASLVVLGRVYENMGESLLNSDIPYYLTADQRQIYVMGLQDQAYPLTEKAIEWYKAALDKAYELTLYNDDTAFTVRRLGELRPNDFPGLAEEVLTPRYTATKDRSYKYETEYK